MLLPKPLLVCCDQWHSKERNVLNDLNDLSCVVNSIFLLNFRQSRAFLNPVVLLVRNLVLVLVPFLMLQ